MAEMLVMRRANGDLFTEEVSGRPVIPVWSSRDAVARYRERNPELLTYLPARLNDALLRRIRQSEDGHATFFLMSEDAPDANLKQGRVIALDELLADQQPRLTAGDGAELVFSVTPARRP